MTSGATVAFRSNKQSDVPRVGQRKRVKINGKMETLYVSDISVRFRHDPVDRPEWSGTYTLMSYYDMVWR